MEGIRHGRGAGRLCSQRQRAPLDEGIGGIYNFLNSVRRSPAFKKGTIDPKGQWCPDPEQKLN